MRVPAMIVFDVATKVLDTEKYPKNFRSIPSLTSTLFYISCLVHSGKAFTVTRNKHTDTQTHRHTHTYTHTHTHTKTSTECTKEDLEVINGNEKAPFQISITKYSNNWKLHRVTAWANRFINNVREKEKKIRGPLTAKEIQEARIQWIKHVQYERVNEISQQKKPSNNLVTALGLKRDQDGFLRYHGRFNNAEINKTKKHYWT